MKNNRNTLKRIFAFIIAIAALSCILSLTAFASGGTTATGNPGIVLKNYDGNTIARFIINSLVGLLTLSGIVMGFVRLISAFQNEDEKEKRIAGLGIFASLLLGAVVIGVVEMMLA